MDYEIDSGAAGFQVRALHPTAHRKRERKPGKRGQCVGMSPASRRALILWLLRKEVPGRPSWAVTLTVPACDDPDEWRMRFKRFCAKALRDDLPFVWRVELQKRGVPHLHCILYTDQGGAALFREDWLSAWGLLDHPDALRRAVDYRPIESDAWFSYVVFHQFKHSVKQAGWVGRHWGVIGRRLFQERALSTYHLTGPQYDRFRAIMYWFVRHEYRLQRMSKGKLGRMRCVPRFSGWSQVVSDWEFLVDRVCRHVQKKGKNYVGLL